MTTPGWLESAVPLMRQGVNPARSKLILYMKILLPAVALGLLMLLVIWPLVDTGDQGFRLIPLDLKETVAAGDVKMLSPEFIMKDGRGLPLRVRAKEAHQDPQIENRYLFESIIAEYTTEDETWMVLTATQGTYDRTLNYLDLQEGVEVIADNGQSFRTKTARINLETQDIEGENAVEGHGPLGQIKAQGFKMDTQAKILNLQGRSKLIYNPER